MRAIDARNRAAAAAAAAQRQLNRSTAANASTSFRHLQRSSGCLRNDSRNRLTISCACKLVWLYSILRLPERTQALRQGIQAPASEVFSDDEESQGSDA